MSARRSRPGVRALAAHPALLLHPYAAQRLRVTTQWRPRRPVRAYPLRRRSVGGCRNRHPYTPAGAVTRGPFESMRYAYSGRFSLPVDRLSIWARSAPSRRVHPLRSVRPAIHSLALAKTAKSWHARGVDQLAGRKTSKVHCCLNSKESCQKHSRPGSKRAGIVNAWNDRELQGGGREDCTAAT